VQNINLKKLTDNSLLIRFAVLPQWVWDLIEAEVEKQHISPPSGGLIDPTGFDAIDQRAAVLESRPPKPTPPPDRSPPPRGKP
jgi:hypothetical protein